MPLQVEILSTGDELLTGQVVDTNSAWLMDRLWDLGVMVRRKTLVGDDRADLDAAIREATARADLVVMSGGMGPTEDDLTIECVAAVMGVPLELHEPSLRAIEERFRRFGRTLTPNNEKQARFPRGAAVVPNRFGTAPGFAVRIGRAEMVCLPGVPAEYRGARRRVAAAAHRGGARRGARRPGAEAVRRPGVARGSCDAPGHGRSRERRRPLRLSRPLAGGSREVDRVRRGRRGARRPDRGAVRAIFGDAVFGEGRRSSRSSSSRGSPPGASASRSRRAARAGSSRSSSPACPARPRCSTSALSPTRTR
jgi:nicotinamide-nucleotide amidase